MYACMYGQHFQQNMDQPGKVGNPSRGQLNRKSVFFCVLVRENFVSRDGFGRPVPRFSPLILLTPEAESIWDSVGIPDENST